MARFAGFAFVLALGACYSPRLVDGQYLCSAGACPDGQTCSRCGICVAKGDLSTPGDGCPGCSIGSRSGPDYGLPNVALCPAAWSVPGVSGTVAASLETPCGRMVEKGGKANDGTLCSVEDNCAAGWHVCLDDSDAQKHGLSSARCDSLDNQTSFWVTRQGSALGATKLSCSASGADRLVGCGALQGSGNAATGCTVLTRTLGNVSLTSSCASVSNNAWQCGTGVDQEALNVTKPAFSAGGVMCCRD